MDGWMLHFYPGYTAETLALLSEEQYEALAVRIPHIQQNTPAGIIARKL